MPRRGACTGNLASPLRPWSDASTWLSFSRAIDLGYALMQRAQVRDAAAYATVRDLYLAGRIDGIIAVVEQTGHPVLEQLKRQGLPIVTSSFNQARRH